MFASLPQDFKKLGAEAGKAEIVNRPERISLRSASRNATLARPAAFASARPASRNAPQQSMPVTEPDGPTRRAISIVVVAPAAPGIEHSVAIAQLQRGNIFALLQAEAADQDMPPRVEFGTSLVFQNSIYWLLVSIAGAMLMIISRCLRL